LQTQASVASDTQRSQAAWPDDSQLQPEASPPPRAWTSQTAWPDALSAQGSPAGLEPQLQAASAVDAMADVLTKPLCFVFFDLETTGAGRGDNEAKQASRFFVAL
jgi:hypothetical protein